MTAADTAAVLKCAPRTAARRLASAGVPCVRVSQKLVYWRRTEIVSTSHGSNERRPSGSPAAAPQPALRDAVTAGRGRCDGGSVTFSTIWSYRPMSSISHRPTETER
jgi:hypothetical protein